MLFIQKIKGTVLVYTMVLVVLGVFMATVVLNVAVELSLEYDIKKIEISLLNTIETKGDLIMKYARELNNTGSGFSDTIGCPTDFSMSGSSILTSNISSTTSYLGGTVSCKAMHNSNPVYLYFNSGMTDLLFAEYEGVQVLIDSGTPVNTFTDSDATTINVGASYPLSPDGIDDNYDSDNYTISSTGSIYYPDGYIDNDAKARLVNYGYVIQHTGLYNMFWINNYVKTYIDENIHNTDPIHKKIGNITAGLLHLDINQNFKLVLYKINSATYEESKEFFINETVTGTGELAGLGYLQDDLSLNSSLTGNEYVFDFVNNDYALFLENTSTGALLYELHGEESVTGSGIYLSPLKDDDMSIFSFLGNHMIIDSDGKLIGNQVEVFGLK